MEYNPKFSRAARENLQNRTHIMYFSLLWYCIRSFVNNGSLAKNYSTQTRNFAPKAVSKATVSENHKHCFQKLRYRIYDLSWKPYGTVSSGHLEGFDLSRKLYGTVSSGHLEGLICRENCTVPYPEVIWNAIPMHQKILRYRIPWVICRANRTVPYPVLPSIPYGTPPSPPPQSL